MPKNNNTGPVYNLRDPDLTAMLGPSLWRVVEESDGDMYLVRSVPRGVIDALPKRHFTPDKVVADVDAAVADFYAHGGQP